MLPPRTLQNINANSIGCLAEASIQTNVQPSFLRAATTLQKASANGGAGGNGVNLGKGFPDSFVVVGAVAETLDPAHRRLPSAQSTC